MKTVEVYFSHEENVPYYRTLPNKQLICILDGTWYSAIDDGTWEEPNHPLNLKGFNIVIVDKPEETEELSEEFIESLKEESRILKEMKYYMKDCDHWNVRLKHVEKGDTYSE